MNLTERELGRIVVPTLIVHVDRDMIYPIEVPVALYRGIPGSALWVVPNGEHVPIYGPVAADFLRIAMQHLSAR